MSLFAPNTSDELIRRNEKRLNRLERRARGGAGGSGALIVGGTEFWPGTSEPPGFLVPFGTTLVNGLNTHSALAAAHPEWVVGANIVVPDYGGHTMVHHKPGDSLFGTKGAKVGSKTHTLHAAEIPTGFVYDSGTLGAYYFNYPAGSGRAQPGGGQPHNIVQPSAVGVWCVVAASTVGEYDPIVQAALVAQMAALNGTDYGLVTLASGWTQEAGHGMRLYKRGTMVTLQGGAVRDNWAAYVAVANVPLGYRPSSTIPVHGMTRNNGSPVIGYFEPATNQINIVTAGGSGTTGVRFLATWHTDQ